MNASASRYARPRSKWPIQVSSSMLASDSSLIACRASPLLRAMSLRRAWRRPAARPGVRRQGLAITGAPCRCRPPQRTMRAARKRILTAWLLASALSAAADGGASCARVTARAYARAANFAAARSVFLAAQVAHGAFVEDARRRRQSALRTAARSPRPEAANDAPSGSIVASFW